MARKPKKPKPRISTAEYLRHADNLLANLEDNAKLTREELEPIRQEITKDVRKLGADAVDNMKTARVGRVRVLVPTGENFKRANVTSSRVEERFSKFRLKWLDKGAVRKFVDDPSVEKRDKANFFRHSHRLARNAKEFLSRIKELEPSLEEEVNETIRQIDDAKNDLVKLEVRSWTDMNERLRRVVNGRMEEGEGGRSVRTFDLNRNLWNLSLAEHPRAVVRGLLANASERMAERVTTKKDELPKRAFAFVGAGPDAVSKMTKGSRTAEVLWRVFSQDQLSKRFAKLAQAGAKASHRGLGLGYGSSEMYVPIPSENLEEVEAAMRERRRKFMEEFEQREKRKKR